MREKRKRHQIRTPEKETKNRETHYIYNQSSFHSDKKRVDTHREIERGGKKGRRGNGTRKITSELIIIAPVYTTVPKAGIKVCANQKLNTNFGPVINNLGVRPLKKLIAPSFRIMLLTIRKPDSGFSKFRFWIRVLMTSRGAETIREALAPQIEATKFWSQLALL